MGVLSAQEVAARLGATGAHALGLSDDLPAGHRVADGAVGLTHAAVLVPIVLHQAPTVLLTLRGRHLKSHAGQVCFPGGRIERSDPDAEHAALREAGEEIGLAREAVSLVGRLAEHRTGTGYLITPVVGLVRPPVAVRADPSEVDEVFELPLADVLDPAAHSWREEVMLDRIRRFWVVRHERHLIWGATAAMLVALGRSLRGEPG